MSSLVLGHNSGRIFALVIAEHRRQELWICTLGLHQVLKVSELNQGCHDVLIERVTLWIDVLSVILEVIFNLPRGFAFMAVKKIGDLAVDLVLLLRFKLLDPLN